MFLPVAASKTIVGFLRMMRTSLQLQSRPRGFKSLQKRRRWPTFLLDAALLLRTNYRHQSGNALRRLAFKTRGWVLIPSRHVVAEILRLRIQWRAASAPR